MQTLNKRELRAFVERFPDLHIGVVGDVMLDVFTYGRIDRLSPEAPVPIVAVERDEFLPGGAANVAMNIAALGGRTSLIGRRGQDAAGERLVSLLAASGIDSDLVQPHAHYPTTEKCRYIANAAHVVRIDRETIESLGGEDESQIIEQVIRLMPELSALVFADYGKGFVTEDMVRELSHHARAAGIPIVVDTKPENSQFYTDVSLVTPNKKEALHMTSATTVEEAGRMLRERFQSPVLVTCGEDGMSLFADIELCISASTREPVDVSGAGDTVVAVSALMLAAGATLAQAVYVANEIAGIVVRKPGTAVVTAAECHTCLT